MSETNFNPSTGPVLTAPETQRDRWIKYGGNVALTTVVVIALAALVTWAAERKPKRLDTTAMGLYSLTPQTVNLIKDNKEKIKIVSLYTKSKPPQEPGAAEPPAGQTIADQSQIITDLLEEYQNKGKNIEVESIDPVSNPTKLEDLIAEVTQKYGGEVKKYDDFARQLSGKYKAIAQLADPELTQIKQLAGTKVSNADVYQSVRLALLSVQEIPKQLTDSIQAAEKLLKQKPPDYKRISDNAQESMGVLSAILGKVIEDFKHFKDDKTVPEPLRQYMADSGPRYEKIKKDADAIVTESQNLGELKLDTLREAMKQTNTILIRGERDWKVLPHDQVWRRDSRDARAQTREGPSRPRFAGEQMITTALLQLQQTKKLKVAFVRAGGQPLTDEPSPEIPGLQQGRQGGFLSSVAARLAQYNYDVVEKDLTGSWAAMAQQQGQPVQEPSDEDIKDAVWVVLGVSNGPSMGGMPPSIAPKLLNHLQHGGSALILSNPRGEDLSIALKDWGIKVRTDALAVHELIKVESSGSTDMIESAKKDPVIFEVRDWGASPVTTPLRSLAGVIYASSPVETSTPASGIKVTPIIPVPGEPGNPKSWGETDAESIAAGPKFDSGKDIAGPIYAGAIAEKDGGKGGRVVVVGSVSFFVGVAGDPMRGIVDLLDPDLAQKRVYALRFPGNGELFMNSIFWLSHQDPMIAISPAAMDVNRIADISPVGQKVWRVGVLLIGLPGAVLLLGAMVWLARRD